MCEVVFKNKVMESERQVTVNRNGEKGRKSKGKNVRGLRLINKEDKDKDCNKDRNKGYIGRVFRQE